MPWRFTLLAAAALALLFPLAATAADPPHDTADVLKQNFVAEHEIGHHNQIDPGNFACPKDGRHRHQSTFDIAVCGAGSTATRWCVCRSRTASQRDTSLYAMAVRVRVLQR